MATGQDHPSAREQRLNEVIAAYLEAVEGGEDTDRPSWLDRYPEFADDLKELFAAQDRFGSLCSPPRAVKSHVCPHCHHRIEVDDQPPTDLKCPRCNKHLHPTGDEDEGPESVEKQRLFTSSGALTIRCPHCHNPIEIGEDTPFSDIVCSSCGSHFSLVDDKGTYTTPTVGTIGHFETIEHLGIGAFGSVWKARDTELDRTVALKMPRKGQLTAAETEQFLREARAAAQLRHPNIVTVHEVGRDGETVFIISDLIRGVSLSDWLTGERLTGREAAELCARIADGLHHAHQAGVIHRDLKPSNIMIDADGEPRIMDFGLAKREVGEITVTLDGQALGTPAYISPEQAKGESHRSDRRSDVYSLGVILFELLTGELPFRGNRQMLLHQAIHDEPPSPRKLNRNITRDMATICLKCLEKEPHRRYNTAKEVGDELRRFLRGEPIKARPIGTVARMWRRCKRYRAISSLAAGLFLALVAGLAGVTSQWIRAEREAGIARDHQRNIANRQRDDARRNLYHSLVREAQAIRLARVSGFRREVWDRLKQAAALDTPVKDLDQLRQEAIASLGDFVGLEPTTWEGLPSGLRQIAIRPRAKELAIGLHDGTVLLRELPSGAEAARLLGHEAGIAALSFNLAGNILVSADHQGNVRVWKIYRSDDWACTRKLAVPGAGINTLAITPDGERLFVLHNGAKVTSFRVEDGTTETEVYELPKPDAPVMGTAFTRDGRLLARGQEVDGVWEFLLWDVAKREALKTVKPGLSESVSVTFSPDGRLMVCACAGGVGIYSLAEDHLMTFLDGTHVCQGAVSSDNRVLAASCRFHGLVRLWSISEHRELCVLKHPDMQSAAHVAFGGDGSVLVAGRDRAVCVWDLADPEEKLAPPGHTRGVPGLAFNSEGTMLASAGKDGTVKIWNPRTGKLISQLNGFQGLPQTLAFNADASMLAIGGWYGDIEIWSPRTGERLAVVDQNVGANLWCLDFCADGQYLAAAAERGIRIWRISVESAPNGELRRVSLKEYARPTEDFTQSMCLSPDSKFLAWVGLAQPWHPRVWDFEAKHEVWMVPSETVRPGFAISFSPDSRLLTFVTTDRFIETWNVTTRARVSRFAGEAHPRVPQGFLHITTLSSDGRLFAWASGPTVTVWDTQQKRFLLQLPKERGAVWKLAWSPDGQQLAVSTFAGGPAIWSIPKIRSRLAELGFDW